MLNYVKMWHGGMELYTLIKVIQLKYSMEKLSSLCYNIITHISLCYNIITHNYHMSNLLS